MASSWWGQRAPPTCPKPDKILKRDAEPWALVEWPGELKLTFFEHVGRMFLDLSIPLFCLEKIADQKDRRGASNNSKTPVSFFVIFFHFPYRANIEPL